MLRNVVARSRPALKWLLDHGMDPNLPADRFITGIRGNMTPMNAVVYESPYTEGQIETMEMLLEYGAVLDRYVLYNAIRWNRRGGNGHHDPAVLQWLVDHGAGEDLPFRHGHMLLSLPVSRKNLALVRFFLENGADTTLKWKSSHTGLTVYETALSRELKEIAEVIEEYETRR